MGQPIQCCGATIDKPCSIGDCPHYINFGEACNCSQRLGRGLSQAEVGRALGISRARVGQLEKSALDKCRTRFCGTTLQDHLPSAAAGEEHCLIKSTSGGLRSRLEADRWGG